MDNKEMEKKELNPEELDQVSGGEGERYRTETGTVMGLSNIGSDNYNVATDNCGTVLAKYDAINIIEPGQRVKVALVGMGSWRIVEFR